MAWLRLYVLILLISAPGASPAIAGDAPEDPPRAYDFDDSHVYREFPPQPADLPRERVEIVFDLVGRTRAIAVQPKIPFDFYVIAHHSRVAVRGWELSVEVDPRITVLEREVKGLDVLPDEDEYMVGIKPKDCLFGDTITLVKYTAMVMEEGQNDLTLRLGPATPSSFEPPSPGYLVCTPENDLRDYAACDLCAVVNPLQVQPEGVDAERPSFLSPARGKLR